MESFTSGEPPSWFSVLLHLLMLLLAVGAVAGLLLRKKRKARGYDSILWIGTGAVVSTIFNVTAFHSPETNAFIVGFQLFLWSVILIGLGLSLINLYRQRGGTTVFVSVTSLAAIAFIICLFLPSVPHAREAARRSQCRNNLKQLGLAMHSYYDKYESLPLQVTGEPPRSWRVELLPWIEQKAIYDLYDQSAAWNAESNLAISKTMIRSYSCPSMPNQADRNGMAFTSYALEVDPDGIYSPDSPPRKFNQIPDGLSNTLLIAEVCGRNLIWTDPQDIKTTDVPLGINLPGEKRGESTGAFSSYHTGGSQVLLGDGSVRFISQAIAPETLRSLIKANDGSPGEF